MAKTKAGKKFIRIREYFRGDSVVRAHVRSTPNIFSNTNKNSDSLNDSKPSIFRRIFGFLLKLFIIIVVVIFLFSLLVY